MAFEPDVLSITDSGSIRRIVLNRPARRNAQNTAILDALDAALVEAQSDANVRVIILAAAGAHFSAGHDLKESQEQRQDISPEVRWEYEEKHYLGYCLRLYNLSKPTIAEVQGACIAAGFMVANMCDLIVAADDAYFADPVVHSIGAAAVEVLVHPWVLGLRKAKEFLYTGSPINAAEAFRIGMVNRVVPRADLSQEAMALASRIAEAPPFGVRLTKRSLNRAWDIAGFRTSLEAHFDTHQLSHLSEEMQRNTAAGLAGTIGRGKALSGSPG